jgi:hypothetical protein
MTQRKIRPQHLTPSCRNAIAPSFPSTADRSTNVQRLSDDLTTPLDRSTRQSSGPRRSFQVIPAPEETTTSNPIDLLPITLIQKGITPRPDRMFHHIPHLEEENRKAAWPPLGGGGLTASLAKCLLVVAWPSRPCSPAPGNLECANGGWHLLNASVAANGGWHLLKKMRAFQIRWKIR